MAIDLSGTLDDAAPGYYVKLWDYQIARWKWIFRKHPNICHLSVAAT
jgi:hypothetical protein